MKNRPNNPQTMADYWALKPVDEIGDIIRAKVRHYRTQCDSSGQLDIWRRACRTYFGLDSEGGYRNSIAVTFGGSEGEYVELRGNLFRMLIRSQTVLVTGTRPTYSCRPRAYDGDTTEKVQIGNAICEKYLDRDLETKMTDAETNAAVYSEGWLGTFWDENAGEVLNIDEQTGRLVYAGDVEYAVFRPDEVCRDIDVPDSAHDWVIVMRKRSRWTLAKQRPEHAEHILGAPAYDNDSLFGDLRVRAWASGDQNSQADQITTWEFYHRATSACPGGRATVVVDGVAIADGPNPYPGGRLPVRSLIPSRPPGVAWGYAEGWDLLALQQMYDSVLTQISTTQENFGMQNFYAPPNSDVSAEALSKGSRIIRSGTAPTPMNQVGTAVRDGIAMLGYFEQLMQGLMAMNDASLGRGGAAPSGASLAMSMQISTQNNAGIVRAYLQLFKDVMGDTIEVVKKFASEEQVVHISGKNNAPKVHRFMGSDLDALEGVDVELGSAETRTSQARHQLMIEMLQANLLTSPEQAMQIAATGRLEPAFNGPAAREVCIERENEQLQQGQPVLVLDQDFHADHIARHGSLLADPEARSNPQIVQIVQQHLYEHAMRWAAMSTDPTGLAILAATGQQPSPAAQMTQGAPMGPPGDPQMPTNAAPPNPSDQGGAPMSEAQTPQGPPANQQVVDPTTNPASGAAKPRDARAIPTTY